MNKENRSALDRELFSELIESPIHPLLIDMVRPYVDSCDPKFHLQINGEALWHCREVRGQPSVAFDVLQESISRTGYKLEESARDRVGHAIITSIRGLFWWLLKKPFWCFFSVKTQRVFERYFFLNTTRTRSTGRQTFCLSGHRSINGLYLSSLLCDRAY